MAVKRSSTQNTYDYSRDPFLHPELAWPAQAPITAEEFERIRYAKLEPDSPDVWSYAYVLEHYPLPVLQWAGEMHDYLHRLSRQREGETIYPTDPDWGPFHNLVDLARKMQTNPRALEQFIEEKRQWKAKQEREERLTGPKWRLFWALWMAGFTEWLLYILFTAQPPPPAPPHFHPTAAQVEAFWIVLGLWVVLPPVVYYWRSKNWIWGNDGAFLDWARAVPFGGVAAALMWWFANSHMYSGGPPEMPIHDAWQATVAVGVLVASWVRFHVAKWDLATEFTHAFVLLLVLAPIVFFLGLL